MNINSIILYNIGQEMDEFITSRKSKLNNDAIKYIINDVESDIYIYIFDIHY